MSKMEFSTLNEREGQSDSVLETEVTRVILPRVSVQKHVYPQVSSGSRSAGALVVILIFLFLLICIF